MSKAGKFFSGLLVVILILVGALAAFIATFNIDKYRDQIATALSEQTGRSVKFGGPIKLAVNSHGIGVAAENASIGNPSWASRPQMASIGKLQLGVGLMPLLDKKVVITDLDVQNADIQLETNASNEHNWDMKPAASPGATAPTKAPATPAQSDSGKPAIGVSVQEVSITNSQIAIKDKDGKASTLKVTKLTLSPESRGIAISLNADYNGQPIKLALKTGATDLMAETKWPYDADITYANYHVNAQGNVDMGAKTIDLNPYDVTSGGSSTPGALKLTLYWAGDEAAFSFTSPCIVASPRLALNGEIARSPFAKAILPATCFNTALLRLSSPIAISMVASADFKPLRSIGVLLNSCLDSPPAAACC